MLNAFLTPGGCLRLIGQQNALAGSGDRIAVMITIREATARDLPSISTLSQRLDEIAFQQVPSVFMPVATPARSREWLSAQLASPHIRMFVAVTDGVVGFVRAHIGPTARSAVMRAQTIGWLHELIVDRDAQIQEVGSALLSAVHGWFTAEGVSQARVTLWPFQEGLIRLYGTFGYTSMNQTFIKEIESGGN